MESKSDRSITFFGTGTSHGVPVIGCHCRVCKSTDPHDKRFRSSLLYHHDDKEILIDCGPDFRMQFLNFGGDHLDGVLLTHIHYDHTGGLDDLRSLSYKNGLDIYASAKVVETLKITSPYFFRTNYVGTPNLRFHVVMPYLPFQLADIEVMPFIVNHGSLPILGFKIGNFAYITDAAIVPEETLQLLKGIDTLVVNALRWSEHFAHMNIEQALNVIKLTGARRAFLIHMSHEVGLHTELQAKLPANVSVAYDGLTVMLDH